MRSDSTGYLHTTSGNRCRIIKHHSSSEAIFDGFNSAPGSKLIRYRGKAWQLPSNRGQPTWRLGCGWTVVIWRVDSCHES